MRSKLRVSFLLPAAVVLVCHSALGVGTLTINGAAGNPAGGLTTKVATQDDCENVSDVVLAAQCTDRAFVSNSLAGYSSTFASPATFNGTNPTNQNFGTAITNAIANQADLAGWKVVQGGTLDLTINVSTFQTVTGTYLGGMQIQADVSNYNPNGNVLNPNVTAPTAGQLAWTQALYINYQPNGGSASPTNPAVTLDDYTFNAGNGSATQGPFSQEPETLPITPQNGTYSTIPDNIAEDPDNQTAYGDPIYPFQGVSNGNAINSFFDGPQGLWQTPASFRGIALLSAINTNTDTITIFNDGIDYGFDLKTPEPALKVVSLLLLAILAFAYRRRAGSART